MSFYHALHATRLIQMPAKKKKRLCLFSSATARRKKPKDSFSSDWAEKLAESDKGIYFDQEQWLKELNEQPSAECDSPVSSSTCSASRSKITVEEPVLGFRAIDGGHATWSIADKQKIQCIPATSRVKMPTSCKMIYLAGKHQNG